eukprot:m.24226 g.24226  ORF g.24226 m.24226 type:complete len:628 (+) comp28578_c0_seq6:29-1912(+)
MSGIKVESTARPSLPGNSTPPEDLTVDTGNDPQNGNHPTRNESENNADSNGQTQGDADKGGRDDNDHALGSKALLIALVSFVMFTFLGGFATVLVGLFVGKEEVVFYTVGFTCLLGTPVFSGLLVTSISASNLSCKKATNGRIFLAALLVGLGYSAFSYGIGIYFVVVQDSDGHYTAKEYRWMLLSFFVSVFLIWISLPSLSYILNFISYYNLPTDLILLWLLQVPGAIATGKGPRRKFWKEGVRLYVDLEESVAKSEQISPDVVKDKQPIATGNGRGSVNNEDSNPDSKSNGNDEITERQNEERASELQTPQESAELERTEADGNTLANGIAANSDDFWKDTQVIEWSAEKDRKANLKLRIVRALLWCLFANVLFSGAFQFFYFGIAEVKYAQPPGSCDEEFDCFHSVVNVLHAIDDNVRCEQGFNLTKEKVVCIRIRKDDLGYSTSFYKAIAISYVLYLLGAGLYNTVFQILSFICELLTRVICKVCREKCSRKGHGCCCCCVCCPNRCCSFWLSLSAPQLLGVLIMLFGGIVAIVFVAIFVLNFYDKIEVLAQHTWPFAVFGLFTLLAIFSLGGILLCLDYDEEAENSFTFQRFFTEVQEVKKHFEKEINTLKKAQTGRSQNNK